MNLSTATVAQVLIPLNDFERGATFYRDVLGLPFLFAAPRGVAPALAAHLASAAAATRRALNDSSKRY
ncbi:MAG: hypothetical protein JO295_14615 [Verrucomicrobia bacterium]|nr:hypothetical protein [Verrucomicrobiota bacterium]